MRVREHKACFRIFLGVSVFFALVSISNAEVSLRVLESDGNTPFDGRAIMVGTQLKIVISSDSTTSFGGGIFIKDQERFKADLVPGSILTACGYTPYIDYWDDDLHEGCILWSGSSPKIGDWFTFDYTATEVGDCNVGIYQDDPDPDLGYFALISPEYAFSHVKSRDFDSDGLVNFADFAQFAAYWQNSVCINECQKYDLDENGIIDSLDLALFTEYWLEKAF